MKKILKDLHRHYFIATGGIGRCKFCGKSSKKIDSYNLEELDPKWRANSYNNFNSSLPYDAFPLDLRQ